MNKVDRSLFSRLYLWTKDFIHRCGRIRSAKLGLYSLQVMSRSGGESKSYLMPLIQTIGLFYTEFINQQTKGGLLI
jgi:hypothetical protein